MYELFYGVLLNNEKDKIDICMTPDKSQKQTEWRNLYRVMHRYDCIYMNSKKCQNESRDENQNVRTEVAARGRLTGKRNKGIFRIKSVPQIPVRPVTTNSFLSLKPEHGLSLSYIQVFLMRSSELRNFFQ